MVALPTLDFVHLHDLCAVRSECDGQAEAPLSFVRSFRRRTPLLAARAGRWRRRWRRRREWGMRLGRRPAVEVPINRKMHITTGVVVTGAMMTGVQLWKLLLISEGQAYASYVANPAPLRQ